MMDFIGKKGRIAPVVVALFISVVAALYIRTFLVIPGEVTILEGEEYVYEFKSPITVDISCDRAGMLQLNNCDMQAGGSLLNLLDPVRLKPQKNGRVNLSMKLFGMIPLRTVHVDIVPNKKIVACGNTIGVKMRLDGILVIGLSDVQTALGYSIRPTKDTGIKPGDFIIAANDKRLGSIDELISVIDKSRAKGIKLQYRRGDTYTDCYVVPQKAADDNRYHIGLWVRDSSAGIGTLTFYDPETKCFGALGHGISDIDTGTLMPVESGEILEANILSVKKGRQGSPGELKGVFVEDRNKLGNIRLNCSTGIYGILNPDALRRISYGTYPIGVKSQVKEGHASVIANIDGVKVEEFAIEILKVQRQNSSSTKGMVIKITDKKLLDSTGGIVQGMSGSPIIQDNKIVGAVTHVLVNDPTRGYGIFIEGMIKNILNDNTQTYGMAG